MATYTNERGYVTKYYYDYLGRNNLTKYYNGTSYAQTSAIYDDQNCMVTSIDELGHKTASVQDYLGRAIATREYYTPTAYYTTSMAYDAVGDLLTVTQSNGEVTHMYYDTLNRETRIVYPDQPQESWTHDGAGKVLTATAADGTVKTSSYDTKGQLLGVTSGGASIVNTYDADGNVLTTSNSLGQITYHYNNRNLVDKMTQVISGTSYSFTYAYNAAGQLTSEGYPDSTTVSYTYDNYGRVSQVSTGGTTLLSLTYNLDDSIATKTYCGNAVESYTYNYRGWVSQIQARYGGTTFEDLAYTYDAKGNVIKRVDSAGSAGTETYTYDALDRLIKATGIYGPQLYGYDSVGNRLWMNLNGWNVTFTYGAGDKMVSDGTFSYDYDKNGNLIWQNESGLKAQLVYNSFGQLTAIVAWTLSGSTWTSSTFAAYYYDANGQRARTVQGSSTTNYVYDGTNLMAQFGSDGLCDKYIYAGGLDIRSVSSSVNYAYISDALGSTRFVLENGIEDAVHKTFSIVTTTRSAIRGGRPARTR